jgi:ADP-ribosylation factor-like protein 1
MYGYVYRDVEGSLPVADISEMLKLTDLKERNWTIMKTCALTGEGLTEGLDWLVNKVSGGK